MTETFVENGQVVRRFDLAPISGKSWKIDSETGFLHADVALTWTGVRTYAHADGTVTRELRRPETVLDRESLASLERLPVTRGHPPQFVTAQTVDSVQVGYTGDKIRVVDINGYKTPLSRATITNAEVIADIVDRGMTQTSLGYTMIPRGPREDELVHDSKGEALGFGVWLGPQGPEEYDIEHTISRANHEAAAIPAGRGGVDIGFKLDRQDAVMDSADGKPPKPCIRTDAYLLYDKNNSKFYVHQGNTGRLLKSFDNPLDAQEYIDLLHLKTNPKQVNRGASARNRNLRRVMKNSSLNVQHTLKVGDGPSALTLGDFFLEGFPKKAATVIDSFVKNAQEEATKLASELESARGTADGFKKKIDEQAAEISELKTKLAAAEVKPAVTIDDIRKRVELLDSAKKVLCVDELEEAFMSMPEAMLKAEVVRRKCGDEKLDGVSAEYLSGRFDTLLMFSTQKSTSTPAATETAKIDWLPPSKPSIANTDFIRQMQARLDAGINAR